MADQAARHLGALALDEAAKERFCNDPLLRPFMERVAARYVAGASVADAIARVRAIAARGHRASAEYMGESCRSQAKADAETQVFLDLIGALDGARLDCSISFDLSHIGSVVDPELGYRNARRIAAAARAGGREVMISMEGAERADTIYAIYQRLHADGLANTGITVPARLHRSAADLARLMALPGRIRLVKGAFLEAEAVALARGSAGLGPRYHALATRLLASGHPCSLATHEHALQQDLVRLAAATPGAQYEFECLSGLADARLDALGAQGLPTREYAVFGHEVFLYVLNRIAEQPDRVYQAIIDLLSDRSR